MNINKILNDKMIFSKFVPKGFNDIDKAVFYVSILLTITIFYYLITGTAFTITTPNKTNIKGFAEYLVIPIFLTYSLTSLVVISLTLNKRGQSRKISLLGIGAGIFISFLILFTVGNENDAFDVILNPIFGAFALSFGSIASITILVSRFTQTTMKTSITSVVLFLIFFTFSATVFGNFLLFFPSGTYFFLLLFSILTAVLFPTILAKENVKYDGRGVTFQVINIEIVDDKDTKKLVIKAVKKGGRVTSTLIPRTGRSLLVTDGLEPGDFVKCHYLNGGKNKYIVREMEKL